MLQHNLAVAVSTDISQRQGRRSKRADDAAAKAKKPPGPAKPSDPQERPSSTVPSLSEYEEACRKITKLPSSIDSAKRQIAGRLREGYSLDGLPQQLASDEKLLKELAALIDRYERVHGNMATYQTGIQHTLYDLGYPNRKFGQRIRGSAESDSGS